jgi:hypothetical protein
MRISAGSIELVPAKKADFAAFLELRLKSMRPLGLYAGLGWNKALERRYHYKVFNRANAGINKIMVGDECVGFIGIQEKRNVTDLNNVCIYPHLRNRGIVTNVTEMILNERCAGRIVTASALAKTASRKGILDKYGFRRVGRDKNGKLVHYRRLPHGKKPTP